VRAIGSAPDQDQCREDGAERDSAETGRHRIAILLQTTVRRIVAGHNVQGARS
jgi:hypothetical protein